MSEDDKANRFDLIDVNGPLTIESILRCLQQRFSNGQYYSWVGNILLFVNPYEQAGPSTHVVLSRLAELLLADMPSFRESRVLVFGGLSGSGKTFNADHLLMKMYQLADKTDWLLDLRKYWQVSAVVMRALGTACTQSNKESSRIGRMVEFQFRGRQITKVKINCYFLDQTRMVSPSPTEQNYNIFYQLLAGLSPEEKSKFHLDYHEVRTLHYLSQGTEPKDPSAHLLNHFEAWKSSLAQLGIPFTDVVKVLAAILLLGNVLFYEAKNQELSLQGADELRAVGSLLGVQHVQLQKGLTLRTYNSGEETVQSQCSAAAANSARDALAKALYIRTIVAIMRRVNTLLKGVAHRSQGGVSASSHSPMGMNDDDHMLNVVDLFGYESNEANSLEQLCINWSAEKLQQYYVTSLFTKTVQMCQEEDVDPLFENSVYDCSPCVELIGGLEGGMLEMLNQETLSPRVTSEDIRVRMRDKFKTNRCFVPPSGSSSTFAVRHYTGGEAVYDLYGLLNANADTIADDIIATFRTKDCKFGFVAHLFALELNRDLNSDGSARGQMCRITPAYLQHAAHSDNRQPTTYVQDFQSNLGDMLNVLHKSKPYFVRCIKSNNSQTPCQFDRDVVSAQIQHMAVFETVDLVQSSFVNWLSYDDFIQRYHMLSQPLPPDSPIPDNRELTEELLQSMGQLMEELEVSEDHYGLGRNRVFLNEEFRKSLEAMRSRVLCRAAVKIQAMARMFLAKKHWTQLKFSLQQAQLQGAAQQSLLNESSRSNAHLQNGETPYTVRNYTIVGNYKVGFPQWRIMKVMYPEATGGGGPPILRAGEEVYVLGRSHKRGYLIVEHNGKQLHLPHHFTELRLSPPHSPPPPVPQPPPLAPPRVGRRPQPTYSDL